MPRRPRLVLADIPIHIIQRGNNRQACFFSLEDFQFYLHWLGEHTRNYGCRLHAYVLMTNHVHLLVSASETGSPSEMMRALGQRYVQYINRTYRRSGTLWEGRFRSSVVGSDQYVLACYRYIELNPVRAKMVFHPAEYQWSSYRANANGDCNEILQPHPAYYGLDSVSSSARQSAYRTLCHDQLEQEMVDEIRSATNANLALGDLRFKEQIRRTTGRQVNAGAPGRPRKS